jgi:hypothetical protein
MQRFKSPESAQRFLSVHAAVYNNFNIQRHLITRGSLRTLRAQAFQTWQVATAASHRNPSSRSLVGQSSSRDDAMTRAHGCPAKASDQAMQACYPSAEHDVTAPGHLIRSLSAQRPAP